MKRTQDEPKCPAGRSHENREDAMQQPKTSRDIAANEGTEPRKDTQREQEQAVVKDADKTDQADRDAVHGDGKRIGIQEK
jgi:hypothetical protein